MNRVLVIKHSALGDMALAFGPMQAIREAHPDATITLLTTKPFAALSEASGLFDEIWLDERPKLWRATRVWSLRNRLINGKFDRVYDLQTSNRTAWYFRILGTANRPEWSGTVFGCSHPPRDPDRPKMHLVEMQSGQLADAGITDTPLSDLSWWQSDISNLALPSSFAVLLPGGAAHRPKKRWPAGKFAVAAQWLSQRGITPVVVGGPPEANEARQICEECPDALSLIGQPSLMNLAPIMRKAALVLGNDTGPMHIAALVGARCVVMFGSDSNPQESRPRHHPGEPVPHVLHVADLQDLETSVVIEAVRDILD